MPICLTSPSSSSVGISATIIEYAPVVATASFQPRPRGRSSHYQPVIGVHEGSGRSTINERLGVGRIRRDICGEWCVGWREGWFRERSRG